MLDPNNSDPSQHSSLDSLADAELLEYVRGGNRQAYSVLWGRHQSLAHAIARPLAQSLTEDVVSEAYTSIWEQLQRGAGPRENFRAYLLATVRNVSARMLRNSNRLVTGIELDSAIVDDDTHRIEHAESVAQVRNSFHKLPTRWQQVLWLTEVEGMSRAEAGEKLGLSPNSTTQLLLRAKEGLRIEWLAGQVAKEQVVEHRAVLDKLPRYIRGGWSKVRREEIRKHMEECDRCNNAATTISGENALIVGALGLAALGGGALAAQQISAPTMAVATGLGRFSAQMNEQAYLLTHHHYRLVAAASESSRGAAVPILWGGGAVVATGAVVWVLLSGGSGDQPRPAENGVPITAPSTYSSSPAPTTEPVPTPTSVVEPSAVPTASATAQPTAVASPLPGSTSIPQPTSVTAIAPTLAAVGGNDTVAPIVSGSAQPGATVTLRVGDREIPVAVTPDGAWTLDLATEGLGLGTHSAMLEQTVNGRVERSAVLTFAITLPRADSVVGAAGQRSVELVGVAGATVCFEFSAHPASSVALSEQGRAVVPVPEGSPVAQFSFAYCEGSRTTPQGQISVN